jgi:hypothetical protein
LAAPGFQGTTDLADSWAGIEQVAVGMAPLGYDLQLTRYDERDARLTCRPNRDIDRGAVALARRRYSQRRQDDLDFRTVRYIARGWIHGAGSAPSSPASSAKATT